MTAKFLSCLAFVLRPENDGAPFHDDGEPTSWGITFPTFTAYWNARGLMNPTLADLQALTKDEAADIYDPMFWTPLAGDALPPGVDLMIFDFGVNAGVATSARALQRALGLSSDDLDGYIGPVTLDKARRVSPFGLIVALADLQELYYRSLPTFAKFGHGWLDRTERRRRAAVAMIGAKAPQESVS